MTTAVETMYDLAAWFMDRALNDNEYLQPMKMHRLLYLSQAYFGLAYHGRKLAPGEFVADDSGPIEPHVYRAFESGRPTFYLNTHFPSVVENFLDSIWRRFGSFSAERLNELTQKTAAYKSALKKGRRGVIDYQEMIESFRKKKETPSLDEVIKPKLLKSHKGRAVEASAWAPGLRKVDASKVYRPPVKKKGS